MGWFIVCEFHIFTFLKVACKELIKSFKLKNNSSNIFPFHFNAGFSCQRPSIMREKSRKILYVLHYRTVIKIFHFIIWKCINCQHFGQNRHSLMHSFIHSFIPSSIHSHRHSLIIHLSIHSFIHSCIQSHLYFICFTNISLCLTECNVNIWVFNKFIKHHR